MPNIAKLRKEKGLTQVELARMIGVAQGTLSGWETGKFEVDNKSLFKLADLFGVSTDYILGREQSRIQKLAEEAARLQMGMPTISQRTHKYPVIGEVAAGYDHLAVEDIEGDTVEIPDSYLRGRDPSEFFVLRVKGESMYPMYQDGDLVLVLKQTTCNRSGDIAVVIYDDEAASLKKVEYVMGEDWMKLLPLNQSYPPIRIEGERLEHCKVIGLPKVLIRNLEE